MCLDLLTIIYHFLTVVYICSSHLDVNLFLCLIYSQMAEYRISIYGRKQSEWDQLASWIVNNDLYSENVVWLIQVFFNYLFRAQIGFISHNDMATIYYFSQSTNYFGLLNNKNLGSFSCFSFIALICSANYIVLAIDGSSYKCLAASTVVQYVQRNGNCDIIPEHARQYFHSTFWGHCQPRFTSSAACFPETGVLFIYVDFLE